MYFVEFIFQVQGAFGLKKIKEHNSSNIDYCEHGNITLTVFRII